MRDAALVLLVAVAEASSRPGGKKGIALWGRADVVLLSSWRRALRMV